MPSKTSDPTRRDGRFVKGDPRIRPGPGGAPAWWKHQLSRHEDGAVDLIGGIIAEGQRRLRKRWKKKGETQPGVRRVHLAAAQDVLDRLHGKATQPVDVMPPVDVSMLSRKDRDTLDRLLARVLEGDGAGAGVGNR